MQPCRPLIIMAALVVLTSAACGPGVAVPPTPTEAQSSAPAATYPHPALTPAASPAPPSGGPVPSELLGRWVGKSDTIPPGAEYLTLSATTYRLESADGASTGSVVINGEEIDFFDASRCNLRLPAGVGRYRWTLVGGVLHFAALNKDACGRAAVLADANYRRAT